MTPTELHTMLLKGNGKRRADCPLCHGHGVFLRQGPRISYDDEGRRVQEDRAPVRLVFCWSCLGLDVIVDYPAPAHLMPEGA